MALHAMDLDGVNKDVNLPRYISITQVSFAFFVQPCLS
jgi:hypothetical protein